MGYFDDMFEQPRMVEGEDFYMHPKGYRIMTEKYLRNRGYCCSNGCKHCPYDPPHVKGNRTLREK